jgi:hypothetical protein
MQHPFCFGGGLTGVPVCLLACGAAGGASYKKHGAPLTLRVFI